MSIHQVIRGDVTDILRTCPFSGKMNSVTVNTLDFIRWRSGVLIQDAFPYLSAGEREIILTGIDPVEWEEMFGGENDDVQSAGVCHE